MKRIIVIITLIVLLCQILNSQSCSITDFQQPVSTFRKLFGTLNMSYQGFDTLLSAGLFNLSYTKVYVSLPFSYSITASLKTNYTNYIQDTSIVIKDNGQINPHIEADIQKYLFENSDFFIAGTGYLDYQKPFRTKEGYLQTSIGAGAGYGRIITATAMAKALRIEEYLLSEKLITGEFRKDITMEIASHCYKLGEYAIKYGDKHPIDWYMDLEKILVRSGKLVDNRISPYSLFRIEEVLNRERIYERTIGWRFTGYFNYNFNQIVPNPNKTNWVDQYGTTLKIEIGYPLSNRLQFSHYTYYYYLNTNKYLNTDNRIFSNTALSYKFSNLFDFIFGYRIDYDSYNSGFTITSKTQTLSFDLYYYLENNIYLQLSSQLKHNYRNASLFYYGHLDEMYKSITLNFGYRFF